MANWGVDLVNSLRNKTATAPLPPFIIHLKLDESMLIDEVEHGAQVCTSRCPMDLCRVAYLA